MDLNLQVEPRGTDRITARYACPCGCKPELTYMQGTKALTNGCWCGNEFAVGLDPSRLLGAEDGYLLHVERLQAPWGDRLVAAWMIGPSKHDNDGDHPQHGDHDDDDTAEATLAPRSAVDPVWGMTVDVATATARDLHLRHVGNDYYFCGKGCKLEFGDDPDRFRDPSYVPSR